MIRPALLLVAYLAVLIVLLPAGINRSFALHLTLGVGALMLPVYLLHLRARRRHPPGDGASLGPKTEHDRARGSDLLLILIPMAPVLQHVALNLDILSPAQALFVISIFSLVALIFVIIVPLAVRRFVSRAISMMIGLVLLWMVVNMPTLTATTGWYRSGDALMLFTAYLALVAVAVVIYQRRRDVAYSLAVIYLVATLASVPVLLETGAGTVATASAASSTGGRSDDDFGVVTTFDGSRPDVFLLTYDGYVVNETMLQYGIDNSDQEDFLESEGFHIYRDAYSVAADSLESMGRVLGPSEPERSFAGDGFWVDVFRARGYETYGIFPWDYWFRRWPQHYDVNYPSNAPANDLTLVKGILEGEFRSNVAFARPSTEEFVATKRAVFSGSGADPIFMYTHTSPNHSPLNVSCREDETARFARRLANANEEMRADVATILEHRPDAIIIVNGDHGPYVTKSCDKDLSKDYEADELTPLDIQDRFGSFLAVRWPEGVAPPDIDILQNVLPAVMSVIDPDLDLSSRHVPPVIDAHETKYISGLSVEDGLIRGGAFDGTPLFAVEEG